MARPLRSLTLVLLLLASLAGALRFARFGGLLSTGFHYTYMLRLVSKTSSSPLSPGYFSTLSYF